MVARKKQEVSFTGKANYHPNGTISSCTLAKEYKFRSFILPIGTQLYFNEKGVPVRCNIHKEVAFYGLLLPAETIVFFNHWGHEVSFWLNKDARIQGYLVRSSSDGIGNGIHSTGKLKAIWLADEEEINGVPCSSSGNVFKYGFKVIPLGTKQMVWFYDDGTLQQTMVSRNITIQGYTFEKGDVVFLDRNGKVDKNAQLME